MIPGFVPIPYTLENHIHLGVFPLDGSPPSGMGTHGEPPYIFTVQARTPTPEMIISFQRTLTGNPVRYTLKSDDQTRPLTFMGMTYKIRCDQEGFDVLKAMLNFDVLWVDNWHCPNGEDHEPYVKRAFFENMTYDQHLDPVLQYQLVNITLRDMYTAAPL